MESLSLANIFFVPFDNIHVALRMLHSMNEASRMVVSNEQLAFRTLNVVDRLLCHVIWPLCLCVCGLCHTAGTHRPSNLIKAEDKRIRQVFTR